MTTRSSTRLGIEDHFSPLPHDCLLSVFLFLDRDTLDELECVSEAICKVVNDPSITRIKRPGHLYVYERHFGHCLRMDIDKDTEQYSLMYEIDRDKKRGNQTAKGVRSRRNRPRVELEASAPLGRSTVVPAQIFDNARELLKKHVNRQITLASIKIDNNFIDQFQYSMQGARSLDFYEVIFDDSLDLEKLSEFLLDANLQRLKISIWQQVMPPHLVQFLAIFDEQFLTRFAAGTPEEQPELKIRKFLILYHWIASKEILPILCRFKELEIITMGLKPEYFVELIMMILDPAVQDPRSWQFSLTKEITEGHLSAFESHKYIVSSIFPTYTITNISNNNEVKFNTWRRFEGEIIVTMTVAA